MYYNIIKIVEADNIKSNITSFFDINDFNNIINKHI